MPIEVHIQINDTREDEQIAAKCNYEDLTINELNNMLAEMERIKFNLLLDQIDEE